MEQENTGDNNYQMQTDMFDLSFGMEDVFDSSLLPSI